MIKFHCDVCGDVIDQKILNEVRAIERYYVEVDQHTDKKGNFGDTPNELITQYQLCSRHMKEVMKHLKNITQWQWSMYSKSAGTQ